ncbi:hypothetical protein [Tsuneonella suprasediminis]|uniref:hypothetical protein n=1 Tax=Tsuneonella suprasediminis TaxID=2306996 RepID=UPI00196B763F|nr:hypothetical protein [Tsuneonella suprasediminis]
MNRIALTIAALAGIATVTGPAVAKERLTGEQQLEKMLEGRVAGKPQSCISRFQQDNMKMIDGTALVYGRGKTLWVNVPTNPDSLDDSDILVTRQFGGQLCRMDMVNTVDRMNGFYTGNVFLSEFVPYTRTN